MTNMDAVFPKFERPNLQIEKTHLFGVSLGGAIIARFAAEHGDRVRSLAYQVPVIKGVEPTLALRLTRLPVLGTFLARLVGIPAIIASALKKRAW